jgi:hypothetical protein
MTAHGVGPSPHSEPFSEVTTPNQLWCMDCTKEIEFILTGAEGRIAKRRFEAQESLNSILADLESMRHTGKVRKPRRFP